MFDILITIIMWLIFVSIFISTYLESGISGTMYSKTSFVLMCLELLDGLMLGMASSRIEPRSVCN